MATDVDAREYLQSRGVKAAPVTIVDDEVIIGYYPKKLLPALKLDIKVDLGSNTEWLADKYDRILGAAIRATGELSRSRLEQQVPWRPQTLGELIIHILSFPELAWLSHVHGSMSTEDMRASNERLQGIAADADAIARYGEDVKRNVVGFLRSNDTTSLERVVPAHYGGEVTVIELLNIILRHSTHHLNQVYWFMDEHLGINPGSPATEQDLEGIPTPVELI
ncbi:MAG: DinB family protein [Dehalococcoidia bacterium]|nr:DinB family protein [Dehalococcoidia bacterium]